MRLEPSRMQTLPARIGINALFLEPHMGGLEAYVRELVGELISQAPGVRFTVYCNPAGEAHLQREDWASQARIVAPPLLGRRGLRALSELTVLGVIAGRDVDLLHSLGMTGPLRTRAVNIVTVADVTWLRRGPANPSERLWRLVVPAIARRADRVIAISQAGARDIEHFLRVPSERVDVTLLGHAIDPRTEPLPAKEVRRRFSLGEAPVVLMVGTRKPHKNLPRLIAAMPEVLRACPDAVLVLAGHPQRGYEEQLQAEVDRLGMRQHIVSLAFVEADELEGLYATATCFVLPSTNEGFGLPVLEAMARGVPVACSNVSSLPEAGGDGARYFDPYDVSDIARAIIEILSDEQLADHLIAAGRRQAASLTWGHTAERTLASYERAWRARGWRDAPRR
jgi:glycosyltransferase involved in cell wall biosynthesis